MDELINKLAAVRGAIQSLEKFQPTEHNCNQILACCQILRSVEAELAKMKDKEEQG